MMMGWGGGEKSKGVSLDVIWPFLRVQWLMLMVIGWRLHFFFD